MRRSRFPRGMDEAFSRERYDADAANQHRQSWKDYQDWVNVFYQGKRFPPVPGWNDRRSGIVKRLPADRRGSLEPLLDEVGRLLAAEWAKDNAVRKVSTGDLQAWGKQFGDAAASPGALEAALREVKGEVVRRGGG